MEIKIQHAQAVKFGLCLIAFAVVGCAALWYLARTSEAVLSFTHHPSASFGIAAGQTARLNVVNPDARERKIVVLRFLDENGNLLKTARAVVEPKHSFGLLLPASETGRGGLRVQLRAEVLMQGDRSNRLLGNVEIFDEVTGRTSFGLLLPASGPTHPQDAVTKQYVDALVGTPQQVDAAVRQAIEDAAKGGGYILCDSNSLHPGVNPENCIAMFEATKKHGKY